MLSLSFLEPFGLPRPTGDVLDSVHSRLDALHSARQQALQPHNVPSSKTAEMMQQLRTGMLGETSGDAAASGVSGDAMSRLDALHHRRLNAMESLVDAEHKPESFTKAWGVSGVHGKAYATSSVQEREEAMQEQMHEVVSLRSAPSVPQSNSGEVDFALGERLAFSLGKNHAQNGMSATTGLDAHVFCGLAAAAGVDMSTEANGAEGFDELVCKVCKHTLSLPAHCKGSTAKTGFQRARMVCAETPVDVKHSHLSDPAVKELQESFADLHKLKQGSCHRTLKFDRDGFQACQLVTSLNNAKMVLDLVESVGMMAQSSPLEMVQFEPRTLVTFDLAPEAESKECADLEQRHPSETNPMFKQLKLSKQTKPDSACDLYTAFRRIGGDVSLLTPKCVSVQESEGKNYMWRPLSPEVQSIKPGASDDEQIAGTIPQAADDEVADDEAPEANGGGSGGAGVKGAGGEGGMGGMGGMGKGFKGKGGSAGGGAGGISTDGGGGGAGYRSDDDESPHHPKKRKSHKHQTKDEETIKKEADSIVDEMTKGKADDIAAEAKKAKKAEEDQTAEEESAPRRRVTQQGGTTKASRHDMEKEKAAPAVHVKMVVQGSFDDLSEETLMHKLECDIAAIVNASCDHKAVGGSHDDLQEWIPRVKLEETTETPKSAFSKALAAASKTEQVTMDFLIPVDSHQSKMSKQLVEKLKAELKSCDHVKEKLKHLPKDFSCLSAAEVVEQGELITCIIISDRLAPLSAAIGSIVNHTSAPMKIYIIAHSDDGLQDELMNTLPMKPGQDIEVLSMDNVTNQLLTTDYDPVWTWDEYGKSMGTSHDDWMTDMTLQQEMWDHDPMHSSPFNHLRFYLPYIPFLQDVKRLIFLDDDVIVRDDISKMIVDLPKGKVMATPCDTWVWGDSCSHFDFVVHAKDWRKNSAVMYLNPAWRSCGTMEDCRIPQYEAFIQKTARDINAKYPHYPPGFVFEEEPVWNFGVVLIDCLEWKRLNITDVYHAWQTANYETHVWPEDSLSYGLGLAGYLPFAGAIICWNDVLPSTPFRDGLGFVSVVDLQVNNMNIDEYIGDAIVLHWSGRNKPWAEQHFLEYEFQKPWDETVDGLGLGKYIVHGKKVDRKKAMFFTEARSGSEWFMDLLDHHPQICATGDRNNPTAGFGREALIPEHYSGTGCGFRFPTCSVRLSCNWGFFSKWVPHYHQYYHQWCRRGIDLIDEDVHATHGQRLCEAARILKEEIAPRKKHMFDTVGTQHIWELYETHAFKDDSPIVPCGCQNQPVQMFKVMRSWFGDTAQVREDYRDASWYSGNFDSHIDQCGEKVKAPTVDWSQYHVVEWVRKDIVAECVDIIYSDDSTVEYVNAEVSDIGNAADSWRKDKGPHILNVTNITSCITEIQRERQAMNGVKLAHQEKHGGNSSMWMTLYYEECIVDHVPCLERIATFLGVDAFEPKIKLEFDKALAMYARKGKDRKHLANKMRRYMRDMQKKTSTLDAFKAVIEDPEAHPLGSSYSAHSHAHALPLHISELEQASLRAENKKLINMLASRSKVLEELKQDYEVATLLADDPCANCQSQVGDPCYYTNSYGSSQTNLFAKRQKAAMATQLRAEREKLAQRQLALASADFNSSIGTKMWCVGSSPPLGLLLDNPQPTLEECGDEHHDKRFHDPTGGGNSFQHPDLFDGIANVDDFTMGLIEIGMAERTKPIYYFVCDEAAAGNEIGEYLMKLPSKYIVPGSKLCEPFDFDEFEAAKDEVDTRQHPVLAMGDGRTDKFMHTLWSKGISKRMVIVWTTVRDVLEHRVHHHHTKVAAKDKRFMKVALSETGDEIAEEDPLEDWIVSPDAHEMQIERFYNMNPDWQKMSMRDTWDTMMNSSVNAALSGGIHADEPGAGVWFPADAAYVLQREEPCPIPSPAPGTEAAVATHFGRVGVIGSHADPMATLCVFAKTSSLPIEWESYGSSMSERGSYIAHEHMTFEAVNTSLNENIVSRMAVQEEREFLLVAFASDRIYALAETLGCLSPGTTANPQEAKKKDEEELSMGDQALEDAKVRGPVDRLGKPILPIGPRVKPPCLIEYYDEDDEEKDGSKCHPIFVPAEQPLYYFMHTPKTAGSAVSGYLMQLEDKWRVPGAAPSADFNFTEFIDRAHEVARRPHPVIAFSHLPPHIFIWKIRGLGNHTEEGVPYTLSRRPVIVLGLVRDTLTQRLSYYDDFVKPHPKRHLYHPDVKAYPDMLSWCRAPSMVFSGAWKGDYPQEVQLRPFYDLIFGSGLNSAWKAVALDDAWEEASKTVSRTGGRIGFVGAQSNLLVSMCVFSRLTEFPIPWDKSNGAHTNTRFVADRPADMVKSFNDTTARQILTRDAREALFVQLVQADFQEVAARTGCMPSAMGAPIDGKKFKRPRPVAEFTNADIAALKGPPVPLPKKKIDVGRKFMIMSMTESGDSHFEELLRQHPHINTWGEMVRELAGASSGSDDVNGSDYVTASYAALEKFNSMPQGDTTDGTGGTPGNKELSEYEMAKPVQGFKWYNLHGGLDLLWYPPRNGTEKFGPYVGSRTMKTIIFKRDSSIRMQLETYKMVRTIRRLKKLNMTCCEFVCEPDDEACLEKAQDDPIALDIPELFQGLNNNERIWKEYERWALENLDPSNVLVLSYEELLATPQETMNRAYSFLGVPTFQIDITRAANQYDTSCLSIQISNGAEIKQAMEGTKWEIEISDCGPIPPSPPAGPPPLPAPWIDWYSDPRYKWDPNAEPDWDTSASPSPSPGASPSPLPMFASPGPSPAARQSTEDMSAFAEVRDLLAKAKLDRQQDVSHALEELASARAQFARAEEHLSSARKSEETLRARRAQMRDAPSKRR